MVMIWQAIFFALLLINAALAVRVFTLFRPESSLPFWKTIICIAIFLAIVVFGVNLASEDFQSNLHDYLLKVLTNNVISVTFSIALIASAGAMAAMWYHSESLLFVPDTSSQLRISRRGNDKLTLIGTCSPEKPLIKRFMAGDICLHYSSEGFTNQEQNIQVARGSFGLSERRVIVALPLSPTFSLHGFHFYPEDLYGEPSEGPHYPQELADSISTTVAFTLACSSPIPIRIQNVFIRVLEADPLQHSTFPISEGGGNGVTPVIGWVELSPQIDSYQVMTNVKRNVGNSIDPADFHVRVFSRKGYEFKVSIEVEWMDLRQQDKTQRFLFPDTHTLSMPEVLEWQDIARKGKKLRMLFDAVDVHFLRLRFERVRPDLNFTVLVATTDAPGRDWIQEYKQAVCVPEDALNVLAGLVGVHKETVRSGNLRQFIIVDDHTLILQKEDQFEIGEIVNDQSRIQSLIEKFDDLEQHYRNPVKDS